MYLIAVALQSAGGITLLPTATTIGYGPPGKMISGRHAMMTKRDPRHDEVSCSNEKPVRSGCACGRIWAQSIVFFPDHPG